jgi:hypothetical protein
MKSRSVLRRKRLFNQQELVDDQPPLRRSRSSRFISNRSADPDQSRTDDRQSSKQGARKPPGSVAKARAFAGTRLQWSSSGNTFVEIRGALSTSSLLVVLNGIAIVCRSIVGNNMNREIVFMIASVLAAPSVSFDELGRASCSTALTIRAFRDPWKMAGGGSHSATTIADGDRSHRRTAKEQ